MSTSTFSYAQAAKGQLATQAATSQPTSNNSQTPSLTDTQNYDVSITNTGTRDPSIAISTSSNEVDSSHSARSTSAKADTPRPNSVEPNQDDAKTAAPATGSTSSSKVGGSSSSVDGGANAVEARGRSTSTRSDAGEHLDSNKEKKTRKTKSAGKESDLEKEPEKDGPPPKVELSEAPVPSVNIWVQRQQQAAKAKIVDQPPINGVTPAQSSGDSKARSSQVEATEGNKFAVNGRHGSRKDSELLRHGGNQGPKRVGPRGTRAQEKESDTSLLVNNSASWPTPETAAVNLKQQPPVQSEKLEKEEKDDSGTSKPKQKKEWVHLPNFVPTVKFETALPSRGPRGGRVGGSRGGRDAAVGPHASADRHQDANAGARINSGAKRTPAENLGPREGRRNISHAEQSRLQKEPQPDNASGDQTKPIPSRMANGTTHEPSGQDPVLNQSSKENARISDPHRDARVQSNGESHHQAQNGSNHRNGERARGGGRGRGGYNQSNGVPHYTQGAYAAQHHPFQYQTNGSRHLSHYGVGYQSMPYSFPGQPGPGQRKTTNGNRRQGSGRVPTMAPLNVPYDANMYPPPNSGIYPFDTTSNLLQLAQTQLEYYFSKDNFVKDWYLRTHMDSQGFVPVTVVASFNRMRDLFVDHSTIRQACIDSALLELVIGGDGIERVRSKEGWEQWVIADKSLRDPAARHDGPSTWHHFSNGFQYPIISPHFPVETPIFSPTSEHGFTHYPNNYGAPPPNLSAMNGINGHTRPHESQLSATVPEFSPSTASAFKSLKPKNGTEDSETSVKEEFNGSSLAPQELSLMNNGVMQDQPRTNGASPSLPIEGH
ncbi:hypothetical protein F4777DRAFT_333593 [Nemania sp. FL0916]|nr:hypothetical protein F4777DRAFT_333593 [Nemania sp. FL0916]